MSEDLYAVLKVPRTATQAEIKRAYRDLARKHHPDKNPGDSVAEEIFKGAAEAYRVLGDEELRAQYDRLGAAGGATAGTGGSAENPGDIFNDIFGTRPRSGGERRAPPRNEGPSRARPQEPRRRGPFAYGGDRGSDLKYTLRLEFEDAAMGIEREIYVPRQNRCPTCGGTGAEPGSAPQLCPTCSGRGNVQREQGFFSSTEVCPDCEGRGKRVVQQCRDCGGEGDVRIPEPVRVSVPAGVEPGARLKIRGAGDQGSRGGERGDLYVNVEVLEHPFFQREGHDVIVDVPIRMSDAVLGATIEVPTLDGKVRMRVPAGSQPGRVFRLKGKGIPVSGGRGRGDQRVRIEVEIPSELTEAQRQLLEQFADIEDEREENPRVRSYESAMARLYGVGSERPS